MGVRCSGPSLGTPSPRGQTYTCENSTFPYPSDAGGKEFYSVEGNAHKTKEEKNGPHCSENKGINKNGNVVSDSLGHQFTLHQHNNVVSYHLYTP